MKKQRKDQKEPSNSVILRHDFQTYLLAFSITLPLTPERRINRKAYSILFWRCIAIKR